MDPGLSVLFGTAITGMCGVVVAAIGAWASVTKSEDRVEIKRLRKQVETLGGDPDED